MGARLAKDGLRWLETWAAAPGGTAPEIVSEQLGLAKRAHLGWMARDPVFKRRYRQIEAQHFPDRAAGRRDKRATVEARLKGERFLAEIETRAQAGQPLKQLELCRSIGLAQATMFAWRNPSSDFFRSGWSERYWSIVGAATIAAEERAAYLATTKAKEVEAADDDPRMLVGVCGFLRQAPGSGFRDQRHLTVEGNVQHQHTHQGVIEALVNVSDRFLPPGQEVDVLDAEYEEIPAEATA